MADYLIQNIPEDTMRDFKTACAWFKRTMRDDLLASMVVTIHQYKADVMTVPRKPKTAKKKGKE